MQPKQTRGFTLIELLIVIAIIGILVTIAFVALNPAEQLARSRDSKRFSDLDAMRSSLSLYVTQATGTPSLDGQTGSNVNNRCVGGTAGDERAYFSIASPSTATSAPIDLHTGTTTQSVDGTGWLPARLADTPGGSPLAALPLDPTNDSTFYYVYGCNKTDRTFEITARLESALWKAGGSDDKAGKDGGNATSTFEVGSALNILPNNGTIY